MPDLFSAARRTALAGHPASGGAGAGVAHLGCVVERAAGEYEAHPRAAAERVPAVDDVGHADRQNPLAGGLREPVGADRAAYAGGYRPAGGVPAGRSLTSRRWGHAVIQ